MACSRGNGYTRNNRGNVGNVFSMRPLFHREKKYAGKVQQQYSYIHITIYSSALLLPRATCSIWDLDLSPALLGATLYSISRRIAVSVQSQQWSIGRLNCCISSASFRNLLSRSVFFQACNGLETVNSSLLVTCFSVCKNKLVTLDATVSMDTALSVDKILSKLLSTERT
jgi:hypothetical protein